MNLIAMENDNSDQPEDPPIALTECVDHFETVALVRVVGVGGGKGAHWVDFLEVLKGNASGRKEVQFWAWRRPPPVFERGQELLIFAKGPNLEYVGEFPGLLSVAEPRLVSFYSPVLKYHFTDLHELRSEREGVYTYDWQEVKLVIIQHLPQAIITNGTL